MIRSPRGPNGPSLSLQLPTGAERWRQWRKSLREQIRRRWLRLMKRLVPLVDRLPRGRGIALRQLSRLPAGWVAAVALAEKLRRRSPEAAIKQAQAAIRKNPFVWQGHVEHVLALEAAGRFREAALARAAALGYVGAGSLAALKRRWFGTANHTDRESMIRACASAVNDAGRLIGMVLEMGEGDATARAIQRLMRALGPNILQGPTGIERFLPVDDALDIVRAARQMGAVRAPLTVLEKYREHDAVQDQLAAIRQDLDALEGRLHLEFAQSESFVSRKGTSLYLLHNSLPSASGGYATRSHGLLTGLNSLGVEAVAVTRPGFPPMRHVFDQDPHAPALDIVDGIRYHRLIGEVTSQPRSDLQGFVDLYSRMLAPLVGQYRPAVIHGASNWWNGFGAIAAARRFDLPCIYEIRGLWEVTRASRVPGWESTERFAVDGAYEAAAARRADRVLVITEALGEEMVRRGVPGEKIVVVPNAVDVQRFGDLERDEQLAEELGVADKVVIGFAGTFTFYEGLDDLLIVGAELRKLVDEPFCFLFVGDGPVRGELEMLAYELGLGDITIFTGRVPHSEVARYLSIVDIAPFPRKPLPVCEMVSPLKPLEAMASGISVLGSDVGALKEMIPVGAGLTFRKGSISDLMEKLRLLIEDQGLRSELGHNARRWVATQRSWQVVSRLVADVYAELT